MTVRSGRGAVMGLVIVSALVLVLIGLAIFFLSRQLGGGKELQHATDAGSLNIAKQVLKRPGVPLQGADEANHFADSTDPTTNEVNLSSYNRLVAQAVLVAMNAQAEGTGQATTNAQAYINLVNGIGQRLTARLSDAANVGGHFHGVAQKHAMRMLGPEDNAPIHVGEHHAVAFMAREMGSNVYVNGNQIPQGGPGIDTFTIAKDGKNYIRGYKAISIGSNTIWGVPVRPQEPPHLVSLSTFDSNQARGSIPEFVPPNTFKCAAQAKDAKSTLNVLSFSSAVVGALTIEYRASIPRGVIIVDNSGSLSGTYIPGGEDIWSNQLMEPNFVEVMGSNSSQGLVCDVGGGAGPLAGAKNYANTHYDALIAGDVSKRNTLKGMLDAAGIDQFPPGLSDTTALSSTTGGIDFLKNTSLTNCTNTNTTSSGQPCNVQGLQGIFNEGAGSSGGGQQSGLMAVQKYHLGICEIRAGGAECANFSLDGSSGLQQYSRSDCGLDDSVQVGTLNQLLALTGAMGIKNQIEVRLYQIKPDATPASVSAIFDNQVPFGQVSYIYLQNNQLVLASNPPGWSLPVNPNPDGTASNHSQGYSMDGMTNCDGECGWPHPWDCPLTSQASGTDDTVWTPSSGFRNILGVIKLRQHVTGGGEFCCPC